jgi:hypothetical protein
VGNPFQAQLRAALSAQDQASLDRILLRSRADLDHALATTGAGAPSTAKRAEAVRMAVTGGDLVAIAASVGLSESRVTRVIENVLSAGLRALYPGFVEFVSLPDGLSNRWLWNMIWPLISEPPSKAGVSVGLWNPAIVADFLVHSGKLQDTSVSDIASVIKDCMDPQKKPMSFDFTDSHHPMGKPAGLSSAFLLFACSVGFLALGLWKTQISVILFATVMVPITGIALTKQILEQRLLRKVVARHPAAIAAPIAAETGKTGNSWPAPNFQILHGLSLPAIAMDIPSITDTRNAVGEPPLRVLYLWVFASQNDQGGFETEGWPQLGPVHLLLNSSALSVGQLMKSPEDFLVADQESLDRTISEYTDTAGTYDRPKLFVTGTVGSRVYRGFPIHTLVCNDLVWKPAVHQLAARCDLAVVNLSGYNPTHPGLEYEIRHLFAGGPPSRFVFVYERTTDADAVISGVLDLWSRLEREPANIAQLLFLRIPDSQDVGYQTQFQKAIKGTGWMAKRFLDSEGDYVPIAPRILAYMNSLSSKEARA